MEKPEQQRGWSGWDLQLRVVVLIIVLFAVMPVMVFVVEAGRIQRERVRKEVQAASLSLAQIVAVEEAQLVRDTELTLTILAEMEELGQAGETCQAVLAQVLKISKHYTNVGVADVAGEIYCSGLPLGDVVNITDRDYFQQAMSTERFSAGGYQIGRITGKSAVNFGYPVYAATGSGEVVGVVYAALDLQWVEGFVDQVDLPEGATVTLVDGHGEVLVRIPDDGDWVGKTVAGTPLERVVPGEAREGLVEVAGLDGVRRYFAYRKLDGLSGDRKAVVLVGTPTEYVTRAATDFIQRNLVVMGIVLLVAGGMTWLFSEWLLTRKVERLLAAAKRLAAGDLGVRSGIRQQKSELGQLARAFDQMAASLERKSKELKVTAERLRKRTVELEKKNVSLEEAKAAMLNVLEDEKELEEALQQEKTQVEEKVKERTRELEEKTSALQEAQEKVSEGWLKLQEEKARLQASMQALPLGLLIIDVEHEIQVVNEAFVRIIGKPEQGSLSFEWITGQLKTSGMDFHDVCPHCREDREMFVKEDVEYQDRFLRIFSVPVEDQDELIGAAIVVEDVTEAKQLEKTRDEFFSVTSHELRTPLTAIRGNAAMMKEYYGEEIKDPDAKQMIEDVHTASVRLIAIVNNFLDLSRLELNKIQFAPETFDLVKTVKESMREVEPTARDKGLSWDLDMPDEGKYLVQADRARVQQVWVNLLGNAVKYTKKGGVRVWVEQDDRVVRVKVTDTGIGIAEDQVQYLFQKFRQVGAEGFTRNVSQSSGLGLYVTKLLVEQMGGRVYLEWSELGKGSTFTVELPKG